MIVENEFSSWDMSYLVIMMRVCKELKVTFDFLIGLLCLPVGLRMVCGC